MTVFPAEAQQVPRTPVMQVIRQYGWGNGGDKENNPGYSAPWPLKAQFFRPKSSLVLSVGPWVVTIPMDSYKVY